MTFIRFDVLAFTWMLVVYLTDYVAVMPRRAAAVVLGIVLGLILFTILAGARIVVVQ